ncbi:anti-sigma factor [Ramlibacter rhizophilus]|uniref:RNA polymerase subunit sigma-70 n=1 Tax=Ramlibacter rhizophilus TaxID=1781167 RepID=A0A4Z0BSS4_9BURK|nr:anti-sigma factor [Ramlibacter rhizophilus]TFZ01308.1 RNA polymerase subunit sigma-70 [Ramlibacter rhizophilus]
MDLTRHPELAQRLAAAYALGTLRGPARRRFETLARRHPGLRANALQWQERLAAMTELQPVEGPSPNVWKRIEMELARERQAERALASQAQRTQRGAAAGAWWRGLALGGVSLALAGLVASAWLLRELDREQIQLAQVRADQIASVQRHAQVVSQLESQPLVRYVAVLEDDRSAPSVLVTFDPRANTLTLKRLGDFQEGSERSLQLWALPPGEAPRSLGVLGRDQVVRLSAPEAQVRDAPALAISLEPRGGVPSERGPTGPVLFKGPLLPTS